MGWFWNFKQRFTTIDVWQQGVEFIHVKRSNPFEDFHPYGKYIVRALYPAILTLVEKLKPLLISGEINYFKYVVDGNQTGEFAGKLPILIVYVTKKEREHVERLLASLGATDVEWSQENLVLSVVDIVAADKRKEEHDTMLRKKMHD